MDVRAREVLSAVGVTAVVLVVVLSVAYAWTLVDPARERPAASVADGDVDGGDAAAQQFDGPSAVIVGRVTDSAGSPVEGVRVMVTYPGTTLVFDPHLSYDTLDEERLSGRAEPVARTDADGRYRATIQIVDQDPPVLQFVPPNDEFARTFSGGGAHLRDASRVEVAEGEEASQDAVMHRAATLSGRLTGTWTPPPAGEPRQLQVVRLDAKEERIVRSFAVEKRTWQAGGLPPGRYRVRVSSTESGDVYHPSAVRPVGATMIRLAEGERREGVDVELRAPARASGRVLDRAGVPVAGADVYLVQGWYSVKGGSLPDISAITRTDWRGRWSAEVPTGTHQVHLYAKPPFAQSTAAGDFAAVAGRSVTYDVTVDRPAVVSGRLDVEGLRNVNVVLEAHPDDDGGAGSAWLSDTGRPGDFSIMGLRPGTYRMVAHDAQGRPLRLEARGAHSPRRFVVRHGWVLTDFDLKAHRGNRLRAPAGG